MLSFLNLILMSFFLGNRNKINTIAIYEISAGTNPLIKYSIIILSVSAPPFSEKRVKIMESNPVLPNFLMYQFAAKNNTIYIKRIIKQTIFEKVFCFFGMVIIVFNCD